MESWERMAKRHNGVWLNDVISLHQGLHLHLLLRMPRGHNAESQSC